MTSSGPSERNRGAESPSVSIEEALELYLRNLFPAGLPPGMDKDALIRGLADRIAQERPNWAAAHRPAPSAPASPPPASYAQLKQAIAERARNDVPADPDERYFHERDQEQKVRRAERKQESKEGLFKDETVAKVRSGKTLRRQESEAREAKARAAIEERLRQMKGPDGPDKPRITQEASDEWQLTLDWDRLSDEERKIEVLRLWNRKRLEALKNKESVLAPRFPDLGDGGASLEQLGFSRAPARQSGGSLTLSMEIGEREEVARDRDRAAPVAARDRELDDRRDSERDIRRDRERDSRRERASEHEREHARATDREAARDAERIRARGNASPNFSLDLS